MGSEMCIRDRREILHQSLAARLRRRPHPTQRKSSAAWRTKRRRKPTASGTWLNSWNSWATPSAAPAIASPVWSNVNSACGSSTWPASSNGTPRRSTRRWAISATLPSRRGWEVQHDHRAPRPADRPGDRIRSRSRDAPGALAGRGRQSLTNLPRPNSAPVSVPGLFLCRCGDGKGGSHPFDVEVGCHVFARALARKGGNL